MRKLEDVERRDALKLISNYIVSAENGAGFQQVLSYLYEQGIEVKDPKAKLNLCSMFSTLGQQKIITKLLVSKEVYFSLYGTEPKVKSIQGEYPVYAGVGSPTMQKILSMEKVADEEKKVKDGMTPYLSKCFDTKLFDLLQHIAQNKQLMTVVYVEEIKRAEEQSREAVEQFDAKLAVVNKNAERNIGQLQFDLVNKLYDIYDTTLENLKKMEVEANSMRKDLNGHKSDIATQS